VTSQSGPGFELDGESREAQSFGPNDALVRIFLAELRELDLDRAVEAWNGYGVAQARGYVAALEAARGIAAKQRTNAWLLARRAAAALARERLGDPALMSEVVDVLASVAGSIVIRDLLSRHEFRLLQLPWTWRADDAAALLPFPEEGAAAAAGAQAGAEPEAAAEMVGFAGRREEPLLAAAAAASVVPVPAVGPAMPAGAATPAGAAAQPGATSASTGAGAGTTGTATGTGAAGGGTAAGAATAAGAGAGALVPIAIGAVALIAAATAFVLLGRPSSNVAVVTPTDRAVASPHGTGPIGPSPIGSPDLGASPSPGETLPTETAVPRPTGEQAPPPTSGPPPIVAPTPKPTPKSTPKPPPPTPKPPPPTPTPATTCTVPSLIDLNTVKAQEKWAEAGFTGTVVFSPDVPPQYRIAWQSLTPDTSVSCTRDITVSDKAP